MTELFSISFSMLHGSHVLPMNRESEIAVGVDWICSVIWAAITILCMFVVMSINSFIAVDTGLDYAIVTVCLSVWLLPTRRSKRGICYNNVAGCVAGCPSHAGVVSKRLNLS